MNDTYSDWPRAANPLQGGEAQLLRGKEKVLVASNVCHPILTHSIPKKKASYHSPILYPGAALDLKIRLNVLFPTILGDGRPGAELCRAHHSLSLLTFRAT